MPGVLADLSYVVLPRSKRSKLNQLPYLGRAWYARPSVEWMQVGLASWADIKFSLHGSAHVPPEYLGQVLDIMEAAWPEEDAHLKKFSVSRGACSIRCACLWAVWRSNALVALITGVSMNFLGTF